MRGFERFSLYIYTYMHVYLFIIECVVMFIFAVLPSLKDTWQENELFLYKSVDLSQ